MFIGFCRAFDCVAIPTHLGFADRALVVSIQESVTLLLGAGHLELGTIRILDIDLIDPTTVYGVVEGLDVIAHVFDYLLHLPQFFLGSLLFLGEASGL